MLLPLASESSGIGEVYSDDKLLPNRVWFIGNKGSARVVIMWFMTSPKSVRLKDRDYDVTPHIIAHMYPQIRNGSVKECEVEMVGEECEVYCEDV